MTLPRGRIYRAVRPEPGGSVEHFWLGEGAKRTPSAACFQPAPVDKDGLSVFDGREVRVNVDAVYAANLGGVLNKDRPNKPAYGVVETDVAIFESTLVPVVDSNGAVTSARTTLSLTDDGGTPQPGSTKSYPIGHRSVRELSSIAVDGPKNASVASKRIRKLQFDPTFEHLALNSRFCDEAGVDRIRPRPAKKTKTDA